MRAFLFVGVVLVLLAADGAPGAPLETRLGGARWGASYFPNVPLVTQEGKRVRFFDDLVKDKVVAINFIFTSCGASCPLETARMATVHRLLGDRVGRDVFFYSITIDPEHDTPEVLAAYAERFHTGPGWLFLTGDAADITQLRRKLGVLADETGADGSPDHNLSFVIGNQATGQWMRRSPFENPYVLAEQLGGWLHNWSAPDPDANSYAEAPALRTPSRGESLFRTRCAACHAVGGGVGSGAPLGPDLLGVTRLRDRAWLTRWLAEPDRMLAEKDPIAVALYARYNAVPMPNLQLNAPDVAALIDYLDGETQRLASAPPPGGAPTGARARSRPAYRP